MKLSIVTTVFNNRSGIPQAINSLRSQNIKYLEHIIVDGGSKDGTLEYLTKLENIILISENDKGIYDGLNKGIIKATGDYVGILHSDDLYCDNNVLSKVVGVIERFRPDIIYGNLLYINSKNKIIRKWLSGKFKREKLKTGWMPPHPTIFISRKVLTDIGLYNLEYKISADYDYILRMLMNSNYKIFYINEYLISMRIGGASNKNLKNILKKSLEDYSIIRTNKAGNIITLILKNIRKINQFF